MNDSSPPRAPDVPPRYLSAPDAAKYMCVSVSWLRKATCSRKIRHSKIGVRVVYDRIDLDAFIAKGKVDAETPPPSNEGPAPRWVR